MIQLGNARPHLRSLHGIGRNQSAFSHIMVYIEDIYFFEINTKYISLNVLKI